MKLPLSKLSEQRVNQYNNLTKIAIENVPGSERYSILRGHFNRGQFVAEASYTKVGGITYAKALFCEENISAAEIPDVENTEVTVHRQRIVPPYTTHVQRAIKV